MLHVYPPEGKQPSQFTIRGKVQSYAFKLENCEHVVFKNLDFFATAIKAEVTSKNSATSHLKFDSLNFKYHTYSKRMLGDVSLIDWMDINGVYSKGNFIDLLKIHHIKFPHAKNEITLFICL